MTEEDGQTAGDAPERSDASGAQAAGDGAAGADQAASGDEAEAAVDAAKEAVEGGNEAAGETPDPGAATAEADAALAAARAAVGHVQESVQRAASSGGAPAEPFTPREFGDAPGEPGATDIDLLGDVELDVKIELGRTRLLVEDVLNLGSGAVVELEKLAGDPVDVFVNDRHVAKGEVLVLNDQFSIRINEIIDPMAAQSPTGYPPAGIDADDADDAEDDHDTDGDGDGD